MPTGIHQQGSACSHGRLAAGGLDVFNIFWQAEGTGRVLLILLPHSFPLFAFVCLFVDSCIHASTNIYKLICNLVGNIGYIQ